MMRSRRTKRKTPLPPPPTPAEIEASAIADLDEAMAAIGDAESAAFHLRMAGIKAAQQAAMIDDLDKRLRVFEAEKRALEERLRALWQQPMSVKQARLHAGRMRRIALFWEGEARRLGHGGRESLSTYHHARSF